MKNIYLVQASSLHSTEMPLPYAAAVLEVYALQNSLIQANYAFQPIIFEKKNPQEIVSQMDKPFLVGFSSYIWNFEYNLILAREIKKVYPETLILFGGHSVPMNSTELLDTNDYIDLLIFGEGELAFSEILVALQQGENLSEIPNIAYRDQKRSHCNHIDAKHIPDTFPSPYEAGILDNIIIQNQGKYKFTGTLETNRGCPFSCGYCDWGLNNVPVRKMTYERVMKDIEWMGVHEIYTCYGADSNFGMFPQDIDYADKLVQTKEKYGFPKHYFVSFSKSSDNRVFEITRKFNLANMLQGATLSFQSLNPATLKAIGRTNMGLDRFRALMEKYNAAGIKTYSEIILGLPCETFESFTKGLGLLMENGQHHSINIYNFELLRNSDLGQPDKVNLYGIKIKSVPFRRFDVIGNEIVQEKSNLVVETSTMSFEDWCKAHLYGCAVKALHCGMLMDCVAMHLFHSHRLPYNIFYLQVLEYHLTHANSPLHTLLESIISQLHRIGMNDFSWEISEPNENIQNCSFEVAIRKLFLHHYAEVLDSIPTIFEGYQSDVLEEVIDYQKAVIQSRVLKNDDSTYTFNYALHEYIDAIYLNRGVELKKVAEKITTVQFKQFVHCGGSTV
mgnify:FL=1